MIEFIRATSSQEYLRYFENQQSLEKFETFEKSRDTWNGFAENLNLFNYWLSLKKKIPAVISSLKWKEYYKNKENKK